MRGRFKLKRVDADEVYEDAMDVFEGNDVDSLGKAVI